MAQGSRVTACGVWIQHTEAQQGTAIDLVAIRSPCGTSLAQICRVYTMLYNALEIFRGVHRPRTCIDTHRDADAQRSAAILGLLHPDFGADRLTLLLG